MHYDRMRMYEIVQVITGCFSTTTIQATNKMQKFRFIDPFKSALNVSGANYAHPQEHNKPKLLHLACCLYCCTSNARSHKRHVFLPVALVKKVLYLRMYQNH
jgi:hypothetical protein